jgi:hypothetical protein
LIAYGKKSTYIRPLKRVATQAAQSEIVRSGQAAMFSGDRVIILERRFVECSRQPAVFATATRAAPDRSLELLIHVSSTHVSFRGSERLAALGLSELRVRRPP